MRPYDVPDNPIITNCERTGYPDGNRQRPHYCVFAGKRCYGGVVECAECLGTEVDPEDRPDAE